MDTGEYESELHAQGWPVSPQTKWPLGIERYPRSRAARYSTNIEITIHNKISAMEPAALIHFTILYIKLSKLAKQLSKI